MKFNFSKSWCARAADVERGFTVAAGKPVEFMVEPEEQQKENRIAFSKFISLARRKRRLTVQALAEKTETEFEELLAIESDPHAPIGTRTVSKLSHYFGLPIPTMMQLAGKAVLRSHPLPADTVRAAAHSASMAALTPEEQDLLEAVIASLTAGDEKA